MVQQSRCNTDGASQMSNLKISPFDSSRYLIDEEAIAAYLGSILEEDDAGLLADAIGQIAKARGMTEIAQASGMTRESLYKALRADAQPRFETLSHVLMALGLRFTIEPIKANARASVKGRAQKVKAVGSSRRKLDRSAA